MSRPDVAQAASADRTGPVLLIGSAGMLGRAWARFLERRGIEYEAPPVDVLDLTDPASLDAVMTKPFRTVINCAGFTDVDGAETRFESAERLNGTAVGDLAERCVKAGALLVHYSTDYVFDGASSEPYAVSSSLCPINAYGRSKALGESLLLASDCRCLLIRSSWLYAVWGKNFVRTIADLVRRRDCISVVNDQRGRPASCGHLVEFSFRLIRRQASGIYHITDGGQCTWYELACEIGRHVNPDCRVEPCTSKDYPRPAPRPRYSILDLSEIEKLFGPMPDWKVNLVEVLEGLGKQE